MLATLVNAWLVQQNCQFTYTQWNLSNGELWYSPIQTSPGIEREDRKSCTVASLPLPSGKEIKKGKSINYCIPMSSFMFNLATSFSSVVDKHVTAFVRPFQRFTSARILLQEPSGLNWPTTMGRERESEWGILCTGIPTRAECRLEGKESNFAPRQPFVEVPSQSNFQPCSFS